MRSRCSIASPLGAPCRRVEGHDGWHRCGRLSWKPAYVDLTMTSGSFAVWSNTPRIVSFSDVRSTLPMMTTQEYLDA